MVRRYAHLSVDHLADYVGKVSHPEPQSGTNLIQKGKSQ